MRGSYLSILIALALLLSAASPSPQPSEMPSPRERVRQHCKGANNDKPNSSIKSGASINEPDQQKSRNVTSENKSETIKVSSLPFVHVAKDLADYGVVLFSALLVVVTALQLLLLKRALANDRPLLWVRRVEIGHDPPNPNLPVEFREVVNYVSCIVQNLGEKGAIIVEAVARLKFASPPLPLPPTFADCIRQTVLQPMVTADEPTNL